MRVLVADAHRDRRSGPARLAEQPQQHDLLLQRLEHRLHDVAGSRAPNRVRLAVPAERRPAPRAARPASRAGRRRRQTQSPRVARRARSSARSAELVAARRRHRPAGDARVEPGAQVADRALVDQVAGRSTMRCSTRPVSVISTSISRRVAERDQLDVPHRRAGQRSGTARRRPAGSAGRAAGPSAATTSSRSTAPSRNVLDGAPLGRLTAA